MSGGVGVSRVSRVPCSHQPVSGSPASLLCAVFGSGGLGVSCVSHMRSVHVFVCSGVLVERTYRHAGNFKKPKVVAADGENQLLELLIHRDGDFRTW